MILKPDNNWIWLYDQEQQKLTLDLGADMLFLSHYSSKKLIPAGLESTAFSIDDAAAYYQVIDKLTVQQSRPKAVIVQLALNAVAAIRFHMPLMPQSWFFTPSPNEQEPFLGDEVILTSAHGVASYIVIESCEQISLCMLVERNHQLASRKCLSQFDVIKVMNNRLNFAVEAQHLVKGVG